MKRRISLISALVSSLLVVVMSGCVSRPEPPEACSDVAASGQLNVLTINLLFSEIETRDERLASIAEFAAANRVDVLLLQEVVGGVLVETDNSARDLQDILAAEHDLNYDLRVAFETGIPGLLALANGVLSRCEIQFRRVERLPKASELEIGDRRFPIRRVALMTRLDVPDFGEISVYNTHWCADCTVSERQDQLEATLAFVERVEDTLPGADPILFGGDLNLDIFRDGEAERPLYDDVVAEGFLDTAAVGRDLDDLCETPRAPDEHCTVGVSELNGPNARRIDYLFAKRFGDISESRVVFNPLVVPGQPTVSDHAAVFSRIELR